MFFMKKSPNQILDYMSQGRHYYLERHEQGQSEGRFQGVWYERLYSLGGPRPRRPGHPRIYGRRGPPSETAANTGLRLVDLVNHGLVLFTLEFPSEILKSDLNP